MKWTEQQETVLYLRDGDLPNARICMRLKGGLRREHMAHDLQAMERRARLIIEQHKAGEWPMTEGKGQMPNGYDKEDD